MATATIPKIEYPTSDHKPMAETDWHRDVMIDEIQVLSDWYADESDVYVSGNMLIYYVPGDKRRHLSPDVFVVYGVPKRQRPYYLIWEEGKTPSVVIEITSKTTKREDMQKKKTIYQDAWKVQEYFLFDPLGDYLRPRLQGYRLNKGIFMPIELVQGRLPSRLLNLHLEANAINLRLYNPETKTWLPTSREKVQQERERALQVIEQAHQERACILEERERALREMEQLHRGRERALEQEVERLRQQLKNRPSRKNGKV
jgi:Uma2 family endonuclease